MSHIIRSACVNSEMPHASANIAEVVRNGLCTGCGACEGVCPNSAITFYVSSGLLLPEIREDKCTNCSLCLKCCPGCAMNSRTINLEIFRRQPADSLIGNYLRCYLGHSTDEEIRRKSTSGGIVTQLLISALESGLIDAALVTRMRKDNPLEPESFLALTKEDIICASKSKYCPVSLGKGLKDIVRMNGKFAVVGLPCQIHGIRKAEAFSPILRQKIVLHVGLFCSHTVDFSGTDFLLKKFGVKKEDVAGLDYRGGGWPGSMLIRLKNGRSLTIRYTRGWNAYWNVFSPLFFAPLRCMMCPDAFNELADISTGDAWLPELKGHKGESVVIARTRAAEEILARMKKNRQLSLMVISPGKVKESQASNVNFKKRNLPDRLAFFKMMAKAVPDVGYASRSRVHLLARGEALLCYFSYYASSNKRLQHLLLSVPLPLFRLYSGLFKCTLLLSSHGKELI